MVQNKEIEAYLEEKKILDDFRVNAVAEKIPIIDEIVGRFLEIVCFIKKPKNVLEIGCGCGYSTYFLMKNLDDGSYIGVDLNRKRVEYAEKFIKNTFPGKKSVFLAGNAIDIIPQLKDSFDLVFIDAAKYEYPLYIKKLLGKLAVEALIIADNVFYKNKIFGKRVSKHDYNSIMGIRKFIDFITNDKYFNTKFINIGDGVSFSRFLGA